MLMFRRRATDLFLKKHVECHDREEPEVRRHSSVVSTLYTLYISTIVNQSIKHHSSISQFTILISCQYATQIIYLKLESLSGRMSTCLLGWCSGSTVTVGESISVRGVGLVLC